MTLDVRFWHLADNAAALTFVRYWSNSGQTVALAPNGSAANETTATLAMHCGNDLMRPWSLWVGIQLFRCLNY
jgi:hypothetical protein